MQVKDPKLLAKLVAIQGPSTRKLAEVAGWSSHTYVQRLLRGEVNTLKPEPAILIARYLEVPIETLFVPRSSADYERLDQENRPKQQAS